MVGSNDESLGHDIGDHHYRVKTAASGKKVVQLDDYLLAFSPSPGRHDSRMFGRKDDDLNTDLSKQLEFLMHAREASIQASFRLV
jgi:hypothetical protein